MSQIETLSLILSITGLVASIIFGISIFDLHKRTTELKFKEKEIDTTLNTLSKTLVNSCACIYPMFTNKKEVNFEIQGRDLVDWVKCKYNCEKDLEAVNIINTSDQHVLVEQYIKEKKLK